MVGKGTRAQCPPSSPVRALDGGHATLCPPYAATQQLRSYIPISPEVIVHADLDGVEVDGAGVKQVAAQIVGLAAEAGEHVFALGRPVRREQVFEAAADGVSSVRLAIRNRHAER